MTKTTDWDQASSFVADAYFPHRLQPVRQCSTAADMTVQGVDLGSVRVAEIGWGADVVVHTAHEGGFAINIPLASTLISRIGGHEVRATPERATVYQPDTEVAIFDWPAQCRIIGVRFDADYLRAQAQKLFSRPVPIPDHLLMADLGAEWIALLRQVMSLEVSHALVREQLAGVVSTAFLVAVLPDDVAGALPQPRIVRRVVDAIQSDPARSWTSADLAEISGVGIRRLQEGFREYLGVSPRDYVAGVRLDRVRAELESPIPGDTVTDIAMRWGFLHVGRFAALYRARFGEAPSATLRAVLDR